MFLGQAGVNAERRGDFSELFVCCPQERGRIDKNRSEQVRVRQTDAEAV